jgi:penicillin-binding protein 2
VGGTSYRSRITGDFKMGGKTGTSQVRVISKKEREDGIIKNKDLPWEERDHGLFIGYGPTDNPLYALSIIIEHGGSGSGVAAPLAKKNI